MCLPPGAGTDPRVCASGRRRRVPASIRCSTWILAAAWAAAPSPALAEPDDKLAEPDALPDPAGDELMVGEVIVVIDEAPRSTTATVREIDARTIAATPRRSADDVLRLVPGLHLNQHGAEGKAQQYYLRGFDAVHGSDLAVNVAGIPMNEPSNVHGHGYVDVGFVVPEAVALLRGRKGSFDVDQGDFATAGSVDLELGVPAGLRGTRVGYEAGTTNRHRVVAVVAPAEGPDEEVVAVEAMHDAGFGQNRSSERVSALAQTRLQAGRWSFLPLALAYAARFGEPGVVPLADVAAGRIQWLDSYARDGRGASRRLLAGLRARRVAGDDRVDAALWLGWRQLSLDENFTGWLMHPEMGDRRLQEHDALSGGGALALHRALPAGFAIAAGADLRVDRLRQREDGLTPGGMPWMAERSLRGQVAAAGGHAALVWKRDAWRAAAGARGDLFRMVGDDRLDDERDGAGTVAALSPRASASWQRGAVTLFGAYGRGLRSPEVRAFGAPPPPENQENTLYVGGEPRLARSDSGELGARVRPAGGLEIGGAAFATRVTREAVFDHVSGVNATLDESRRLGAEVDAVWSPATGIDLRLDATFVDARFAVSGNPVPGAPRLMASLEARAWRGRWTGAVVVRHLGARPLAHGATGAAATVVDALAGWRRGGWEVTLQIDNALDAEWREGEYHFASSWDPGAPRSNLPRLHYAAGRPFGARLALTHRFEAWP